MTDEGGVLVGVATDEDGVVDARQRGGGVSGLVLEQGGGAEQVAERTAAAEAVGKEAVEQHRRGEVQRRLVSRLGAARAELRDRGGEILQRLLDRPPLLGTQWQREVKL